MAYEIVCNSENREQWLASRAYGIGASEIAAVMGESGWGSPLTIYLAKTGEPTPEHDERAEERMLWGTLVEPVLIPELAARAGVRVYGALHRKLLRSVEHTWLVCTPDSVVYGDDGELCPAEVKLLAWGYDRDEWEVEIPRQYQWQCQAQMAVTGASRCLFGALIHGQELRWEWVPRDEDMIGRLLVAGGELWRRIQEHDEPPSTGHKEDRRALALRERDENTVELYRADIGDLLDDHARLRAARLALHREIEAAKKAEDAVANQIAQKLGTATRGVTADGYVCQWLTKRKRGYTVKPSETQSFEILEPDEEKVA